MGVTSAALPVAFRRAATGTPARVHSVDVFRGLTMVVMIFVNDVAGSKGFHGGPITWPHGPPKNGMTYVDVVFPTFLFVLGMAIPFAIRRRLEQGTSRLRLWMHIVVRSFSLVVLGLILANAERADPKLTGLSEGAWPTIALMGAILFWLDYPKNSRQNALPRAEVHGARDSHCITRNFPQDESSGAGGLAGLPLLGNPRPDRAGLPGGLSSFISRCGRASRAPPAIFVGLTALNVASRLGMPSLDKFVPYAVWPFDNGELPSIAFAGIVTYLIFFDERVAHTFRKKALLALAYAAVLFAGGWAFSFLGISKMPPRHPGASIVQASASCCFWAIYWLVDVRGWRTWAAFARPAGSNTLLTYLLPDLYYFTLGATVAAVMPGSGWPGAVKSAVFTAFILFLSYLLTRRRIRMQL